MSERYYSDHEAICRRNNSISPRLYDEYGINKGLRDEKGRGVLAGLTNISDVISMKTEGGRRVPCDGELWYRGYRVEDIIEALGSSLGFEKFAYLLVMGEWPSEEEEKEFFRLIGEARTLPSNFTRDVIMKAPSSDVMN